jgi:isopenicillin-N N-acyltransferase-like protein
LEERHECNGSFEVIELSGGPHERGYRYGAQLKSLIKHSIDAHYSWYKTYCNWSKDQVIRMVRKFIPFIDGYSPEIAEEIRGTAEGSENPYEQIVMLTAYVELSWMAIRPTVMKTRGCTGFLATGRATIDGETYAGQTVDDSLAMWQDDKCGILIDVKRGAGARFLAYTYPGIPGQLGINSHGIAICMTGLLCNEFKPGVPVFVICREVLQQKSIGDAIHALTSADRAESGNYLIANENGEVCDIEVTPTRFDCFYVDDYMGHANHFLSTDLKSKFLRNKDVAWEASDSIIRQNRMTKLLKEKYGNIDCLALMTILKDHVNYPNSICKHLGDLSSDGIEAKTFSGIIILPKKRELWIAKGNPCENEFQKYSMK